MSPVLPQACLAKLRVIVVLHSASSLLVVTPGARPRAVPARHHRVVWLTPTTTHTAQAHDYVCLYGVSQPTLVTLPRLICNFYLTHDRDVRLPSLRASSMASRKHMSCEPFTRRDAYGISLICKRELMKDTAQIVQHVGHKKACNRVFCTTSAKRVSGDHARRKPL